MRKTYIQNNDISIYDKYLERLGNIELDGEIIETKDALNRVTKRAIYAKLCDPMYNASAMDGIAVVAENTTSATEQHPLKLIKDKDFVYVNTGNPITGKYNSVIMIEDVLVNNENEVSIIAPSYPWQHVRVKGESIVAGEMVLPSHRKIRPVDVGAIIASANLNIEVIKRPTVGIIPTGNEMVEDVTLLGTGKLMESNSKMFASLTTELNGLPFRYPTIHDDKEELKKTLIDASNKYDVVIINAGSSAGTKDFTVHVIEELGEVFAHGIAIKPGKPTILGIINNKPVIGIPGYPVSAYLVFDLFVKPIILKMQGLDVDKGLEIEATLTRDIVSTFKNAEYIRMNVGYVNNKLVATPLERGAAQIMSLVKADGLLYVDRLSEGIEKGTTVKIQLRKPLDEIKKNLVIIGSHDLVIDVLGDEMNLSSTHVGSMGGILALQRGECHIAPIHLLDEESGIYNIAYIKKYFPNKKMVLIKGVGRTQGIMQNKNANIKSIEEISVKHIPFANRQRGSGTRVLFDYLLKKDNLDINSIFGYEKEYSTHLAVGVAIENKVAECGLGIGSVANVLGLDFVPLANEEYDFLTTYENFNDEKVQQFLKVLTSEKVKKSLLDFGDYTIDHLGEVKIIE